VRNALNSLAAAVTVILIGGLLIVFVGKVRDAAARTQCQNNLHQLGLALSGYHDSYDQFPLAIVPNAVLAPEQCLNWYIAIAPWVEATNLYVRMDKGKGWEAEENRYLAVMTISLLRCPGYPDQQPASTVVPSHYVGIAGIGRDAATLPSENPRAGFFGYARKLSRSDVGRGTGSLLTIVETTRTHGAWTAGGPPTVRGLEDDALYLGPGGQFGGIHNKTTNALVADGSARSLDDSLTRSAFEAMATIRECQSAEPIGD
jgi:hypothetical protein